MTDRAGPDVTQATTPTGRVFVRFTEDRIAADAAAQLRAAGYEIERTVSWAPHTVWVRPHASKSPADARATPTAPDVAPLLQIPGVVSAEPEILRPRVRRGE
jgi:hypothetical protein